VLHFPHFFPVQPTKCLSSPANRPTAAFRSSARKLRSAACCAGGGPYAATVRQWSSACRWRCTTSNASKRFARSSLSVASEGAMIYAHETAASMTDLAKTAASPTDSGLRTRAVTSRRFHRSGTYPPKRSRGVHGGTGCRSRLEIRSIGADRVLHMFAIGYELRVHAQSSGHDGTPASPRRRAVCHQKGRGSRPWSERP